MASSSVISGVREGMKVTTSDGVDLGKVRQIYFGTEPVDKFSQCDDETCIEVHRGGLIGKGVTMYVPCRAVESVFGETVTLNVDMETASAKGWARKPAWIEA